MKVTRQNFSHAIVILFVSKVNPFSFHAVHCCNILRSFACHRKIIKIFSLYRSTKRETNQQPENEAKLCRLFKHLVNLQCATVLCHPLM